jgi:hypothetical protein
MRYPGGNGADPDARVRAAWAAVHTAGSPKAVGAGVVIADRHVITCAHVVNAALGRDPMTVVEPTSTELAAVELLLPAAGGATYRPELICWSPPVIGGSEWWDGDLALLRLPHTAPHITPVPVGDTAFGSTAWAWYADGGGRSAVDVLVQKPLGPWLLLDPGSSELAVVPGYSGGPLWNSAGGTLVGLIVCVEPDVRRYFAIAPAAVRALLARAGLAPYPGEQPREPRQARLQRQLAEALDDLSADRYGRALDRFARALELPHRPATAEETAAVALDHPRGAPALRDAVTAPGAHGEAPGPADRLADVLLLVRPLRLLAPADHAELSGLLADRPVHVLLAAARAAVPFLPLSAEQVPDRAAFIETLEDRESEPGVMPPLLQVVEEIAARHHPTGDELREWSARVAGRLRIKPGALEQVRTQAKARATGLGTARPMVRVWLSVCDGPADAYTYVIRLYDGDDRLLESWSAVDTPRRHEAVCDDLAEAVGRLADHGESAGVEFLLQHGSFDLPIDRWPIPTAPLGPRRLGIDRFVMLRGQEPPRREPWERRWRALGPGAQVVPDVDAAEDTLGDDLDAAFVISVCPPEEVNTMVRMCRWFGVPVMLWHRQAAGDDAARLLLDLVGDGGPGDLRERVRRHRHKARRDDQHTGAHLSLLWEDPRWDPRRVQLAEPARKGGVA